MLHVLSDPFCLHSPLVIKEICLIEPRVDYYGPCLISWNCAVYNVHLILNCDKIIIHYRLSNTMFYPFSSLIFFKTVNCCMFWKNLSIFGAPYLTTSNLGILQGNKIFNYSNPMNILELKNTSYDCDRTNLIPSQN